MLKLMYGEYQQLCDAGMIRSHKNYVEAYFQKSWLYDTMIRKVLVEIDHFPEEADPYQVLRDRPQTYLQLAGGTHTILLAKFTNEFLDFARMGANCYKYIMDIADTKDVLFGVDSAYPEFADEIIQGRPMLIVNTGKVVYNHWDMFVEGAPFR